MTSYSTSDDATYGTIPGDAATGHVKRYVAEFEKWLDPEETPFTLMIKKGESVDRRKVEWGVGRLAAHQVTLGEALDSSELGIDLSSGHGNRIQLGMMLRVEDEIVGPVVGIATDTITVAARGAGGSTATTHSTSLTMDIIGIAGNENSDFPEGVRVWGDFDYNYPQRFQTYVQTDLREKVTPNWEVTGDQLAYQMSKKAKELAILREKALLLGGRQVGSGTSPSLMGGILSYVSSHATSLSSAQLTIKDMDDMAKVLWDDVGPENMGKDILVSLNTKRIIDSLINSTRLGTLTSTSADLRLETIKLSTGTLKFTVSRYFPEGKILFFNREDCSIHPYKGLDWHETDLPVEGDYAKTALSGDFTAMFVNERCRGLVHTFDTTLANYPVI
jgi:hypothetical protein